MKMIRQFPPSRATVDYKRAFSFSNSAAVQLLGHYKCCWSASEALSSTLRRVATVTILHPFVADLHVNHD